MMHFCSVEIEKYTKEAELDTIEPKSILQEAYTLTTDNAKEQVR
jgi:hypothetical protein